MDKETKPNAKQLLLLRQSAATPASKRIVDHIAQRIAAEATPRPADEAETTNHQWRILTQAGRKRRKA